MTPIADRNGSGRLSNLYFGQPRDTARPSGKTYPTINAQPLPTDELLKSEIDRDAVDRFLRSHHTRFTKWELMSYVDLEANTIDVDLLSEEDIDALESALKIEANNPVYVRKILDHFKGDVHASNFVVVWGYEEFKHFYALQAYLAKVWAVRHLRQTQSSQGPFSIEELAPVIERAHEVIDEKAAQVRRNGNEIWEIPATMTGLQVMGYTAYQELITHLYYKLSAKRVREPILRGLLVKLSGDEQAHSVIYSRAVDQTLAREPERVEELVRVYRDFAMPNTSLVQNGVRQATEMGKYMAGVSPAETQKMMMRIVKFLVDKVGEEEALGLFARSGQGPRPGHGPAGNQPTRSPGPRSLQDFIGSPRGQELATRWIGRILRGGRTSNTVPAFS